MASPTLMFCIGATKAGTSWLHRYVAGHPQCYVRGVKELHYFDAEAFDEWAFWAADAGRHRDRCKEVAIRASAQTADRKIRDARDAEAWCQVIAGKKTDDAAYLGYLQDGLGAQKLIGDFTPAYGLLPAHALRRMATLLPDVRFVFLLRDPVSRVWSHTRMMARRQCENAGDIPRQAVTLMSRILKGMEPQIVRRSDYIGPVTRLRATVDPKQVFFGFYEELFTQGAMARLCRFLGIDAHEADLGRRVMEGPKVAMPPGQWTEMRDYLAPQYDAMRDIFGKLPDAWGMEPVKV